MKGAHHLIFTTDTIVSLHTYRKKKKTTTQKIPNQVCFFTYFPPSSFITFNSKDIPFNPLICRKVERLKATVNYYDSAAALWNLMFSIQSKFCINLFVALFQLKFQFQKIQFLFLLPASCLDTVGLYKTVYYCQWQRVKKRGNTALLKKL